MLISRRDALALGSITATTALVGLATRPHSASAFSIRTATNTAPGLFEAQRESFTLRNLTHEQMPYVGTFARPLPTGANYDSEGVAIRVYDGITYDHPVAQAQAALSLISSYAFNEDAEYLRRSRANADRLIATAVESGDALFFPYMFDFALHGGPDVMVGPWFSGMAQGQAISAFCRLHNVTGDSKYLEAARRAVESFKLLKRTNGPWVTNIDAHGFAWYEEYADATTQPDFTFNGHVFAVYGLYDYWKITGDESAKVLFQVGATTMKHYADTIRHPGWISQYCLRHETPSISYHNVHVDLNYKLFDMTGDVYFASLADAFLADFPAPTDAGTGPISAGVHRFAMTNASASQKPTVSTATVTAVRSVKFGSRRKLVDTDGIWLRIDSGEHAGKWVEEQPGKTHIIGLALQRYRFAPLRRVNFSAGAHIGYEYSKAGGVVRSVRAGLRGSSAAHADMQALVNGQLHVHLINGIWKDLWVPLSDGVALATVPLTGNVVTGWDPEVDPEAGEARAITPPKLVRFEAGTHTGYAFDAGWQITSQKRAGLARASGAYTDRFVVLSTGRYYRITGGIWKGLWVRASDHIRLS